MVADRHQHGVGPGFCGDPDLAAYCAAKGGVIALTKAGALAYGPRACASTAFVPAMLIHPWRRNTFRRSLILNDSGRRFHPSMLCADSRAARGRQMAVFLARMPRRFVTGSTMGSMAALTVNVISDERRVV